MPASRSPLGQTPSQTIGPFFHFSLPWAGGADLAGPSPVGRVIEVSGGVLDGAGEPVSDALLEIWQADPAGAYGGAEGFIGFGRCPTDAEGRYRFRTLFPGRAPARAAVSRRRISPSASSPGGCSRGWPHDSISRTARRTRRTRSSPSRQPSVAPP